MLGVGGAFIFLTLLLASTFKQVIEGGFVRFEEELLRNKVVGAMGSLDHSLAELEAMAGSWASSIQLDRLAPFWGGTSIDSRLLRAMLQNSGVDAVLFLDEHGRVLSALAMDHRFKREVPLPADLPGRIGSSLELIRSGGRGRRGASGWLATSAGPLLVVSKPLLKKEYEVVSRGLLVLVRFFDDRFLLGLNRSAGLAIRVRSLNELEPPDNAEPGRSPRQDYWTSRVDESRVLGYHVVRGLSGAPAFFLEAAMPRLVNGPGREIFWGTALWLAGAALVFGLSMLVFLEAALVSRIKGLSAKAEEIGLLGDGSLRLPEKGRDELAGLARSINKMLEALEQSRSAQLESDRRYRAVVEDQTEFIFRFRPGGDIVFSNQAFRRHFQRLDEKTPRNAAEFLDPVFWARVQAATAGFSREESVCSLEEESRSAAGSSLWRLWTVRGLFRADGTLSEYQAVGLDITSRKMFESALEESRTRFREMAELLPESIFEADSAGLLTYVNQRGFEAFGYDPNDHPPTLDALEVLIPGDRDRAIQNAAARLSGQPSRLNEYTARRRDGSTFPVMLRTAAIYRDGRPVGLRGVVVDISDLKNAQAALTESEQKYRTLVENIQDGVFIIQDEKPVFVNEALARMLGRSIEETLKTPLSGIISPDDLDLVLERYRRRLSGQDAANLEFKLLSREGKIVPVNMSLGLALYKGRPAGIGTVKDITARKLAEDEKARLEAQLNHSRKMEAVGTLASGIAHDFNNILQSISGCVQVVQIKGGPRPELGPYFSEVDQSINRASDLVRRLLTFGRKVAPELKTVDLNAEVRRAIKILERTIPKMIALEVKLAPDLPGINADPSQIERMLMNLAANARDAMPDGGRLGLETEFIIPD
ncbi:MAG: PAS domain S-box protein, partial [Pseudomonadota bacterium]